MFDDDDIYTSETAETYIDDTPCWYDSPDEWAATELPRRRNFRSLESYIEALELILKGIQTRILSCMKFEHSFDGPLDCFDRRQNSRSLRTLEDSRDDCMRHIAAASVDLAQWRNND
jgi:hypothetical protein